MMRKLLLVITLFGLGYGALLSEPLAAQEVDTADKEPAEDSEETAEETAEEIVDVDPGKLPEYQIAPEDVAFYVALEGDNREPLPVSVEEWDRFINTLASIYQPTSGGSFLYVNLWQLLEAKVMMYMYAEKIPQLKTRCREVRRKLKNGIKWERVVRLYTEDILSRQTAGDQGVFSRSLRRYPLELDLWELEEGEVGGPYFSKHGAEMYLLEKRNGEKGTRLETLEVRYILMKWASGLTSQEWSDLRRRIRLTTDKQRFKDFLPPALQAGAMPTEFGPTEIAPTGEPDKVLDQTDEIKFEQE